ncbi:type III secretion system stator protein SctL [Chelatococcus sp. GCM10030263]|uniref:type III secretion system stator protein SctL n=1 Tax=Chelatococcus sp. GCM10030263 TaxID=3273387 RepID=UPI0036231EFC
MSLPPTSPTAVPRPGPSGRIVRADEAAEWQESFRCLEDARRSADEIVAEARQAAETITTEARKTAEAEYARAFAKGEEEGRREAARLVARTQAEIDSYLASIEGELAKLVRDILHNVVGEYAAEDLVAQIAAQALKTFRNQRSLNVIVHPDVADAVREKLLAMTADHGELRLTVSTYPTLPQTACRIETEFSVVEADLDMQLAAISAALSGGRATS